MDRDRYVIKRITELSYIKPEHIGGQCKWILSAYTHVFFFITINGDLVAQASLLLVDVEAPRLQ